MSIYSSKPSLFCALRGTNLVLIFQASNSLSEHSPWPGSEQADDYLLVVKTPLQFSKGNFHYFQSLAAADQSSPTCTSDKRPTGQRLSSAEGRGQEPGTDPGLVPLSAGRLSASEKTDVWFGSAAEMAAAAMKMVRQKVYNDLFLII